MTRAEALAEARKRWEEHCVNSYKVGDKTVYEVCGGWNMEHYGSGDSWEAAFRDADRRSPLDPRD